MTYSDLDLLKDKYTQNLNHYTVITLDIKHNAKLGQ
jgi:radical SAM superfamily enzyme